MRRYQLITVLIAGLSFYNQLVFANCCDTPGLCFASKSSSIVLMDSSSTINLNSQPSGWEEFSIIKDRGVALSVTEMSYDDSGYELI